MQIKSPWLKCGGTGGLYMLCDQQPLKTVGIGMAHDAWTKHLKYQKIGKKNKEKEKKDKR